uniref:Uncharacterized protein n=1 Tax=Arion vulgaris TaxID=1028688 RepID=A0A0B6ZSB5_9EUPU
MMWLTLEPKVTHIPHLLPPPHIELECRLQYQSLKCICFLLKFATSFLIQGLLNKSSICFCLQNKRDSDIPVTGFDFLDEW